jgi:uncharacterized damage-inducible protein DinB
METMKKLLAGCLLSCAVAAIAYAQDTHSFVELLVKHWQTSKTFTLAVVNAMPDDQYTFKASPAEMSFGEMGNHIAAANMHYCSAALNAPPSQGMSNEEKNAKDFSKATVTKRISDSFDFCIEGMQKMTDGDLLKMRGKAPRQMTAYESFWGAFTHTAHHRAQLEVYLRLKGIKPPDYKF